MPRTRQHPLIKQTSYDSGFGNSTIRIWCCRGVIIGQVGRASREQRICSEKNVKKWRLAGPQPQQREICSRCKIQGDLQRTRHKTKQAQPGGGREQRVTWVSKRPKCETACQGQGALHQTPGRWAGPPGEVREGAGPVREAIGCWMRQTQASH